MITAHLFLTEAAKDAKKDDNVTVDQVLKTFKLFKPNSAIEFLAKQNNLKPSEYLTKNILKIAAYVIKNGFVKVGDIGKAIKDINKKNGSDNTDIDYDNLVLDEDTMKIKVLFGDKQSRKDIIDFIKIYDKSMENIEEDIEKANNVVKDDIKKSGIGKVDEQDEIMAENVISDKKNKKKSGKELKKTLDDNKKLLEIKKTKVQKLKKSKANVSNALKKMKEDVKANLKSDTKKTKKVAGKTTKDKKANTSKKTANKSEKSIKNLTSAISKKLSSSVKDSLKIEEFDKNKISKILGDKTPDINGNAIVVLLDNKRKEKIIEGDDFKISDYKPSNTHRKDLKEYVKTVKSLIQDEFKDAVQKIYVFRKTSTKNKKDTIDTTIIIAHICKLEETELNETVTITTSGNIDLSTLSRSLLHFAALDSKMSTRHRMASHAFEQWIHGYAQLHDISYLAAEALLRKGVTTGDAQLDNICLLFDGMKNLNSKAEKVEYLKELLSDNEAEKLFGSDVIGNIKELATRFSNFRSLGLTPQMDELTLQVHAMQNASPETLSKCGITDLGVDENGAHTYYYNPHHNTGIGDDESDEAFFALAKSGKPKKSGGLMNGALGWAIVAAKTTGFILNNSKTVVDSISRYKIKNKEDEGVIALMSVLVENGEKSESNFQDTRFSVRFSLKDFKWHATNMDDRKMSFDELKIIDKVFESESGKKFKESCLNIWSKFFKSKDGKLPIIGFVIKNAEQFKLKIDKSIIDSVKTMLSNFDKIEAAFK